MKQSVILFLFSFSIIALQYGCSTGNLEQTNTRRDRIVAKSDASCFSTFKPTFSVPKGEDSFDYRTQIYESSPNPAPGVYVSNRIAFIIVVVDLSEFKKKIRNPKSIAMVRMHKALSSYFSLQKIESLPSSILEQQLYKKEKFYRLSVAIRLSDIENLQAKQNGKKQ